MQFLDKLFARCCREARGDSTVQFLDQLSMLFAVGKPVEIPQCSSWTSYLLVAVGNMPVVASGADGQTAQ